MHPPGIESRRLRLAHRISPNLKLGAALVMITSIALLPRRPDSIYLAPAALLLLFWLISRMPFIYALRRLAVVEVFILGIALLSLVNLSARPLLFSTLIKSNLCAVTMLLLTWTTPFHDILHELRRLRLPSVMLTTLALMYRYLPVLAEESRRMQRARAARTFQHRHRIAWRNLSTIVGRLFLRSADRAERIYLAMCARGWK
jgi:cobalt/nickel transport system permease protein